MPSSSQDYYACPGCGAEVRVGSAGCSRCSPRPAPRPSSSHDDDDFDYDEFVREEFGRPLKPRHLAWGWWATGIILLAAFLTQLLWHP
jgi:hypothetical protein